MRKLICHTTSFLLLVCLVVQLFVPTFALAEPATQGDMNSITSEEPVQTDFPEVSSLVETESSPESVPSASMSEPAGAGMEPSSEVAPFPEDTLPGFDESERSATAFEGIQVVFRDSPGCTFTVEAYDIPNVRSAQVAVWTKDDKSDLKRFDMHRFLTAWGADIDIAALGYRYGTYYIEVFGTTSLGESSKGTASIDINIRNIPTLNALPVTSAKQAYKFVLNADLPANPPVWIEVTPPEGDPIICEATESRNIYTCETDLTSLRLPGLYTATAYSGEKDPTLLARVDFEVEGIPRTALSVGVNKSAGLFAVSATPQQIDPIDSMTCAIWSKGDQSDIRWIPLERDGSSFVSPTLSVQDFGSNFGTYWFHAYATLKNGTQGLAEGIEHAVEAENYVWYTKSSAGTYELYILNPNPVQDVRAAVWSNAGGQDDIVWYNAEQQNEGLHKVTVRTTKHKSSGAYTCHFYAGDTPVAALAFEVPASEMMSEAQRRISNGCQRVYNAVGTDLHKNYLWVVNNLSYTRRYGHPTPPKGYTREQMYAVEGFEKRNGNCYTYAATFAALARGLGYNAQYVEGAVFGVGNKWWPHAFVLIHTNNGTYICDPELQYASSKGRNLYMQPVSSPKAKYRW